MNWTRKQYEDYLKRRKLPNLLLKRSSLDDDVLKYRNHKVLYDGHYFDSKREATVYCDLCACCSAGVIKNLVLQPRFLLQDGFTDSSGKKQRPIYYVADFKYEDDAGRTVVVDVKSKATEANAVYRLKRKLFLFHYRHVLFHEIF